jgi:CRP-like cAMP-binding protein
MSAQLPSKFRYGFIFLGIATGEPRNATVRAVTACECVVLGHAAFGEVLATNPDLAERISDVLASRRAEIDSTRLAQEAYDRASESNLLLKRIKSFFSLWPPDGSDAK